VNLAPPPREACLQPANGNRAFISSSRARRTLCGNEILLIAAIASAAHRQHTGCRTPWRTQLG
jgi:hypothetical protein